MHGLLRYPLCMIAMCIFNTIALYTIQRVTLHTVLTFIIIAVQDMNLVGQMILAVVSTIIITMEP